MIAHVGVDDRHGRQLDDNALRLAAKVSRYGLGLGDAWLVPVGDDDHGGAFQRVAVFRPPLPALSSLRRAVEVAGCQLPVVTPV
jgi:hypothetical protein